MTSTQLVFFCFTIFRCPLNTNLKGSCSALGKRAPSGQTRERALVIKAPPPFFARFTKPLNPKFLPLVRVSSPKFTVHVTAGQGVRGIRPSRPYVRVRIPPVLALVTQRGGPVTTTATDLLTVTPKPRWIINRPRLVHRSKA